MNVTVPPGIPAPGATAATVAVTVTDCPKTDGLAEDATVVVVAAAFAAWLSGAEALAANSVLPAYATVIGWLPIANAAVVKVA